MSEGKTESKENLYQDNNNVSSEGRSAESTSENDVKTAEEIEEDVKTAEEIPPPPPSKATPLPPRKDQEEPDCEVGIEIE